MAGLTQVPQRSLYLRPGCACCLGEAAFVPASQGWIAPRPPPPLHRFFLVGQSAVTLTARPSVPLRLRRYLPDPTSCATGRRQRCGVDYQDILWHHSRLKQTEAGVQLLTWPFRPRRSCGRLPCGRLPCPALPCHSWSTECNQAGKRSRQPSRVVYLGIHTSTHPPVDCSSSRPLASVHSPTSHIHSVAHGHGHGPGQGPACCVLCNTARRAANNRRTRAGLAWPGLV